MLALARALMTRPKLLLLDEPSMGLAPMMVTRIFELVQDIATQGVTVLLVEQNARLALEIASRGYVMESGAMTLVGAGARAARQPSRPGGLPRRIKYGNGAPADRRVRRHRAPRLACAAAPFSGHAAIAPAWRRPRPAARAVQSRRVLHCAPPPSTGERDPRTAIARRAPGRAAHRVHQYERRIRRLRGCARR